jgi:hypothetical protein
LKRVSALGMFTLVALLLAACAGQSAGPSATPTMDLPTEYEIAAPLEQALAFLPAGHKPSLAFIDWWRLKANEGAAGVTSQSPWSERSPLFRAAGRASRMAFLGMENPQNQADIWGWDFSDLEWEAMITLDEYLLPGATKAGSRFAHVAKLRRDMEVAPFLARLAKYGFTSQSYNGFVVYSHAPDSTAAWSRMSRPVMLNVAVVPSVLPPGETSLIFSEHLPVVQTILDTMGSKEPRFDQASAMEPLLKALNAPDAAVIAGGAVCKDWNPLTWTGVSPLSRLSKDQRAEIERLLGEGSPLHPYASFGMGYYAGAKQGGNTMVLNYASPSEAEADLATRQRVIAEGFGRAGTPYSMDVTLHSATRNETALVFELDPPAPAASGAANPMMDLMMRNEMLFAACP